MIDDDIVKKTSSVTYPRPIFMVDMTKTHNTTTSLYDEISGKTLVATSGSGKVFATRNGKRTLQFNSSSKSASAMYMADLTNFMNVYNAAKSGKSTFVVIMEFNNSVWEDRWGMWCFYNTSKIFGWFDDDQLQCWDISADTNHNVGFVGFPGTKLGSGFGMLAVSIDNSTRKIIRTTPKSGSEYIQNYVEGFQTTEKPFTKLGTNNGFGSLQSSSSFIIGRSQESTYFAGKSPNNRYLQFAVFDKGLTAAQLKAIYDDQIIKY